MATTLVDSVNHWRKKLDKNLDEDTILNVIRKLSKVPMTLEILQETHIGKTIRKLSKRNDIVGEKAQAVLKKWRDAFANPQESDRNMKLQTSSTKENINKKNKSFGKHDMSSEKTVHKQDISSQKHKQNSVSGNSPYSHVIKVKHRNESPKYHIKDNKDYIADNTVDCIKNSPKSYEDNEDKDYEKAHMKNSPKDENARYKSYIKDSSENSVISGHPLYTYVKKETQPKYMDYDPHADFSEGYNPECPELFPSEKSHKLKKSETYEQKAPLKRKIQADDQTESFNKSKKIKSGSSDSVCTNDFNKLQMKKEKHKDSKSHSSSVKNESMNKVKREATTSEINESSSKVKVDNAANKKCKLTSDSKSKDKLNKHSSEKPNKSKPKLKLNCSEEFTSSEVRFEDCLGFNDFVPVKKKKSSKPQSTEKKTASVTTPVTNNKAKHTTSSSHGQKTKSFKETQESSKSKTHLKVPKPSGKIDMVNIVSTLPEIQPNYQPLPQRDLNFCFPKKKEVLTNEDAIKFTSSRREKTAVYSGRRNYYTDVPSLFECCTKVLIDNIDAIEYLGGVPYFILKPVLERCTATQLFQIENYNPDLLDSTNELWEIHCKRDYKLLRPDENETWRDLYLRAHDEREKKLKSVTANISASMSKSNPVRQVKLAFVDSFVKPPRDVARRQAKNGTAHTVSHVVKPVAPSKSNPKPSALPSTTVSSPAVSSGNVTFAPKKPKVAPLMAKTLKSMKMCFRR